MKRVIALKGNIIEARTISKTDCYENAYLVTEDGIIKGIFDELPEKYKDAEVIDYGDDIITQSFVDMHLHAPQYAMLGLGMDLPLLDWLNTYTFKTEAMYADNDFARAEYKRLASDLVKHGTTAVCMFSSLHREATEILMEELEAAGITGYVGKVNMDRNSDGILTETCEESIRETRRWIDECGKYTNVKPMITPRFTPSCSDALMERLGKIAAEYDLPVQSHLSENEAEIDWVAQLHPECAQYWETYDKYGLWKNKTIMAHCVHSDERERAAIKRCGIYVAHCPDSNTNIYSGIAPIRRMLNENIKVTLGSDIAGGAKLSMMHSAGEALRASKLRYYYSGKADEDRFLTVTEAFYLATSAGHEYFGRKPGFAAGDKLHAIVFDDKQLPLSRKLTLNERLERLIYADDDRTITARYSNGVKIG